MNWYLSRTAQTRPPYASFQWDVLLNQALGDIKKKFSVEKVRICVGVFIAWHAACCEMLLVVSTVLPHGCCLVAVLLFSCVSARGFSYMFGTSVL